MLYTPFDPKHLLWCISLFYAIKINEWYNKGRAIKKKKQKSNWAPGKTQGQKIKKKEHLFQLASTQQMDLNLKLLSEALKLSSIQFLFWRNGYYVRWPALLD